MHKTADMCETMRTESVLGVTVNCVTPFVQTKCSKCCICEFLKAGVRENTITIFAEKIIRMYACLTITLINSKGNAVTRAQTHILHSTGVI